MKQVLFAGLLILASVATLMAQTGVGLPENPDPNKCYVRCVTPDVYETEEVEVLLRPAYKKLTVIPARYETREEQVLVREGYTRYEIIPAEFSNTDVSYEAEQSYNKLSIVPASFSDGSESIEVTPKIARWEYQPYEGCQSDDPLDCQVLCWREYPAEVTDIPTQKLSADASTTSVSAGGAQDSYSRRVVSKPAEVREIQVDPVYETVTKRVLVEDERVEETTVEAEYQTVSREVLKQKGGLETWEEIECELLEYNVLPINYELGSARLTAQARSIIDDKLLTLMREKPNVKIELSSHTDSRGSASSNQQLSERRAQSVVNYLQSKGINASRLVAKGYGEGRLKNRCSDGVSCTEREHAANRRTEFRILNY
ncbi:MAG: OmpA family protein [Bacteroidota bacterium]